MSIHKEGHSLLIGASLVLIAANVLIFLAFPAGAAVTLMISLALFLTVLQFFRNPQRQIVVPDNNLVYAPADGKIVVIEQAEETEYFQDKRLQVSIFMSPTNVHVNRNPISGTINYFKYHPGKYLVAWHPKSSTENERTTLVIGNEQTEILLRQIAGALAKRIVHYVRQGDRVEQGADFGFIKFGSRVDLFLPLDAQVQVKIGDRVRGNRTVIAKL